MTDALESVDEVLAGPCVATRTGQALVNVVLAEDSCEARHTGARGRVDTVETRRPVQTRVTTTLVHICFAIHSCVSRYTRTRVAAVDYETTSSTIFTRLSGAVSGVYFAVDSGVSDATSTVVPKVVQIALPTVLTRVTFALVEFSLAESPCPSHWAAAQIDPVDLTRTAILTR